MPNIVGSSFVSNLGLLDHACVGCIPHQMNTVMKTVTSKDRYEEISQLCVTWYEYLIKVDRILSVMRGMRLS